MSAASLFASRPLLTLLASAALVACSAMGGAASSSAAAETDANAHSVVDRLSGRCLDVRGGTDANGTPVQAWDCNGTAAQSWTLPAAATAGPIKNGLSGRCLDVLYGGTTDGTQIQIWDCNGTIAQSWHLLPNGSLQNVGSGKCASVWGSNPWSGTPVRLTPCNDGPNEAFDVQPAAWLGAATDPSATPLVWPNATSFRTSDPWLVQHHDEITQLRPRVLVLDFANGTQLADIQARFDLQKQALEQSTRFHGYSDANATPFLSYELAKLVDLTDASVPAGWSAPNSTQMPRRNGGIDFGALFTPSFADLIAIKDPADATRNLALCELLASGVVQEVMIAFNKSGSDSNVPEVLEYKQTYDENDVARQGQFDACGGNGCIDDVDQPAFAACGQSLRVGFLEMTGVIGNALHVNSHNYETMAGDVPHFRAQYAPLARFDLDTRYGAPFSNFYGSCSYTATDCVAYTDASTAAWTCSAGTSCGGQTGTFAPFDQGCGNAHFPPNARYQYDYYNTMSALTTCEHYGLHDGPAGQDTRTPYEASTVAPYDATWGSGVGGGWHVYLFQSFPGYHNRSTLPDGTPMKNFWPYLYY